jgi:hypothetical protein
MGQKTWRLEVIHLKPIMNGESCLSSIEQLRPFQELRDELNQINSPVELQILRNSEE